MIAAHTTEKITHLDNLVLPNFPGLESLGDEQHLITTRTGTDYRELLTVVAHRTGTIAISPAYIDAVDARDGKPKRFLSNSLTLLVGGGALEDPLSGVRRLVGALVKIVLLLLAIFVIAVIFMRGRRARPPQAAPLVLEPPIPVVPPRSLQDELRDGLQHLKSAPTRASVMRLRVILWKMSGAPIGATLADLFTHHCPNLGHDDPALANILNLTERAAFINETHLLSAIDDLGSVLGRYLLHDSL
ncbi:MAG: hypothetical protein M3Y21_03685 [Candidatus Eremiobacteraeota bacterium]|nr:hypothetical protein [Candidatus Eremiobacteraeota bacterium]